MPRCLKRWGRAESHQHGAGSVVDEAALIEALRERTLLSAGLDVYADEPNESADLIAMDNAMLFRISARRRNTLASRWTSS